MKRHHFLLAMGLASGLLACSTALTVGPIARDGVLTDEAGMSLYVWDNDTPHAGKSLCAGTCVLNWPPYLAKDDAKADGDYGLILRGDGTRQWTFRGRPLHRWFDDKKPGDRAGDGFRGIWHLARP